MGNWEKYFRKLTPYMVLAITIRFSVYLITLNRYIAIIPSSLIFSYGLFKVHGELKNEEKENL